MQEVGTATELDLLRLSAAGDRDAQARMAMLCLSKQFGGVTPVEAWAYAEVFAHQAAAHGLIGDKARLAAIQRVRAGQVAESGDTDRASALLQQSHSNAADLTGLRLGDGAELLAYALNDAADCGDDDAAEALDRLLTALPANEADTLRNTINQTRSESMANAIIAELGRKLALGAVHKEQGRSDLADTYLQGAIEFVAGLNAKDAAAVRVALIRSLDDLQFEGLPNAVREALADNRTSDTDAIANALTSIAALDAHISTKAA